MKFKKPSFWDLKKPNLYSHILNPLTFLIKINNFLLNIKVKKLSQKLKTICIGNIYVGGTGKTPATVKLYDILKGLKIKISTAKKIYSSQNDELIILREKTSLISGKNRAEIIKKATEENKQLLIFDDGLQDKYISYDLQFVCFDTNNWVGNGRLIPAGPLRESLKSLKKYDGVFLKKEGQNTEPIINLIRSNNPNIKIFTTNYKAKNLNQFNRSDNYLIFSGIGNPKSFRNLLEKNNLRVIKEIIFPDHYQYNEKDIKKIQNLAYQNNAKIITTEKDFVKIKHYNNQNINFLKIELEINSEDELLRFIKSKLYE
tara:strand:- start:1059 stop:2003 length:945 start_codon:yes stop_codon:yes gene_type:complete